TRFSRDWSSDVCSSDLVALAEVSEVAGAEVVPGQLAGGLRRVERAQGQQLLDLLLRDDDAVAGGGALLPELGEPLLVEAGRAVRSEERRVGKAGSDGRA